MSQVADISKWQGKILHAVPIGKRMKRTMYNPDTGEEFYFKEPESKYPWEFWTEVVASRLGKQLGFDTLEYRPVIYRDNAGCLSPTMVNEKQDLIHGQQYLIQVMPKFEKKKGSDHSFQMVEKVFIENPKIQPLLKDFILMLVFDAVIGNHDRHQQNWAIIRTVDIKYKGDRERAEENFGERLVRKLVRLLDKMGGAKEPVFEGVWDIESFEERHSFSPLFDNGNSLAYNILEEKIPAFFEQKDRFENYLFGSKAHSHVRWGTNETGYIDLLENIAHKYPTEVTNGVNLVANNFKETAIEKIILEADRDFPLSHSKYQLTLPRKELMYKIVCRRKEELLRRLL